MDDDFDVEVVETKKTRPPRPADNPIRNLVLRLQMLPFYVWIAAGLVGIVLIFGTPHLMITYTCYKSGGKCYQFTECNYVGVQGWRQGLPVEGRCSYIRMMKIKW
jgi:hypothetical protein